MRKRIVQQIYPDASAPGEDGWLNIEHLVEVEVSSEDTAHPIESALLGPQVARVARRAAGAQRNAVVLVILGRRAWQVQRPYPFEPEFGDVTGPGGRIVFVQPTTHTVCAIFSWVTPELMAPADNCASGR